jgi:hypothetical protein
VERLLVVTLCKLVFPDRSTTDLSALADQDITRRKPESSFILGAKVHRWEIAHGDVPPLHVAVSQVRPGVHTRLAACGQHSSELG